MPRPRKKFQYASSSLTSCRSARPPQTPAAPRARAKPPARRRDRRDDAARADR
ncbi:MAG: hypothetical protein MZV63_14270 [Marinilabiliales bacterium]|nr:hypothetical protein [Marinilabiliales bacterium]